MVSRSPHAQFRPLPSQQATAAHARNRTLDLAELARPEFGRVLAGMDELLAREPRAYLHPGKRWEYPWALEAANLAPGQRVLDAGCGHSIFPLYLASIHARVTALDLDLDPTLGSELGLLVDWRRGDLTYMPLGDRRFDAVFCISVIEHLPDEKVPVALAELRRVLVPGGQLLLTTDYYEDAAEEIWYEGAERRFRVDWRVFDEGRFRRLILEADGFTVVGDEDLRVDWPGVKQRMRAYHGYPYTSVGVKLIRV